MKMQPAKQELNVKPPFCCKDDIVTRRRGALVYLVDKEGHEVGEGNHRVYFDSRLNCAIGKLGAGKYIIDPFTGKHAHQKGYHEIYLDGKGFVGKLGATTERIVLSKRVFSQITGFKEQQSFLKGIRKSISKLTKRFSSPSNRDDFSRLTVPREAMERFLKESHPANEDDFRPDYRRRDGFGKCWDLFGSKEKSLAEATVGRIEDQEGVRIGLTAMQLRNIGYDYGPVEVAYEDKTIPVEVYNHFGKTALGGEQIVISRELSEKLGLKLGDPIRLIRTTNAEGLIKAKYEEGSGYPLGSGWDLGLTEAKAVVTAIDEGGYNQELYWIGLSAMQIDNLGLSRVSKRRLDGQAVVEMLEAQEHNVPFDRGFGPLIAEAKGMKIECSTYNACGMKGMPGPCIRISRMLADELKLNLGDVICLRRKSDKADSE